MYYVSKDSDEGARQVVPADFSFLSLAVDSLSKAMSGMLANLVGIDENVPTFLGDVVLLKERLPNVGYRMAIGPAMVLWDGVVWQMPKFSAEVATEHEFWEKQIFPKSVAVAPSPVLNPELEAVVRVHYKRVMEMGVSEGQTFTLGEIQTLPRVGTMRLVVTDREVL